MNRKVGAPITPLIIHKTVGNNNGRNFKVRYKSELFCVFAFVNETDQQENTKKTQKKNRGNVPLVKAIDKLIKDINDNNWKDQDELNETRQDADNVHFDGFYFFNINVHRTMILIEFNDKEAPTAWVGTHQEYENTFKNNKNTI